MKKKIILGIVALLVLSSVAVLGSSRQFLSDMVSLITERALNSASLQSDDLDRVLIKAGVKRRSAEKTRTTKVETPDYMLWHIGFDITDKFAKKADEEDGRGQNGNLFREFFTRQAGFSSENGRILKEYANAYSQQIAPIDEIAKQVMDREKESGRTTATADELKSLQEQKNEITFRHRDLVATALGTEEFDKLRLFLTSNLSLGSESFQPKGGGNIYYTRIVLTVHDDNQQPPLISGFSELYFEYQYNPAPYSPSLDSYFVNLTTSVLLDAGTDDGYRNQSPAQYFHPIFSSFRGQQYCTLADYFAVLYDGPYIVDVVQFESLGDCHVVGPGPTPTPTPNVVSVTFSQVNASTEGITPNPTVAPYNPGIGQRIFPDDDLPNDPIDRRLVRVTATLSQPIANVPVYFRNFDLDDPSGDSTIDSNGALGNDNNGAPVAGQLLQAAGCGANGASIFCPSDSSGSATIVFVVTRQPGDNFAIAASTSATQANAVNISGIELTDSAGQAIQTTCPNQLVCRSQMLTVWRRLHLEVDSMGEVSQNRAVGTMPFSSRVRNGQTVDLVLNPTTPPSLEVNRFVGGRILVTTSGHPGGVRTLPLSCDVLNGIDCNTDTTVRVTNPGTVASIVANTPYSLYDDDDFNDNDGSSVDGDTGENISMPDITGYLETTDDRDSNVFADAYVRPVYDVGDANDNTQYVENLLNNDPDYTRSLYDFDLSDHDSDAEFWTVYLLGGYQDILEDDGDPNEIETGQVMDAPSYGFTDSSPTSQGSIVFLEVSRPREYPLGYATRPVSRAATAGHEIGHCFGADHGDHGLMEPTRGRTEKWFSPATLRRIRGTVYP